MARTRRRSLLSKRTPVPTERLVRTPAVLKAVPAEDAPLAPRRVTQSNNSPTLTPVSSQPPRDPALVEFDLADHELPELPMEAFDLIEELDDSELGVPIVELEPQDVPAPSAVNALLLPEFGPPPTQGAVVAPMALAFIGSGLATMFVVLLPWFAFVSPQLDASRQARIAAANVAPTVIEIPMPVPVPVPMLVEAVEVEPEPEPEVVKAKPVARPRRPRPTPVAAADPVPKARPKPRAKPAPAPVAASAVPDAARVLAGTLNGTADGKSMTMRLEFLPGGRLKARISRSGVSSRRASGSYTVSGKRATFALVESGSDAASYTGTVSPSGANGRVTFSDGSKGRLKVRR